MWHPLSTSCSILLMPSAGTSATLASLPDGVTQTFVPEGSECLTVLFLVAVVFN